MPEKKKNEFCLDNNRRCVGSAENVNFPVNEEEELALAEESGCQLKQLFFSILK